MGADRAKFRRESESSAAPRTARSGRTTLPRQVPAPAGGATEPPASAGVRYLYHSYSTSYQALTRAGSVHSR